MCGGTRSRDNTVIHFKRGPSYTSDGESCYSYLSLCLHLFSLSEILALVSLFVLNMEKAEEQAEPKKQEKHVSCLHACLSVI